MSTAKKQPAPFFKERREFIGRVFGDEKPEKYALEMLTVTKIFSRFNNDLDFLSKVRLPSWIKGSLCYFLTPDGQHFLDMKYKEFKAAPREVEKYVDSGVKSGDDLLEQKQLTLRGFLNE